MLGHVVHCQSSVEVWTVLERLFSTKSKARALQLRLALPTTKKGGGTVEDYLLKMKALANSLMAVGQQISDDKLILYVLGCLGPEYEAMIVNLTSCDYVTFQESRPETRSKGMTVISHFKPKGLKWQITQTFLSYN